MLKEINFEKNPEILNEYLLYLRNVKFYSNLSIKGYESDLIMFFKFILQYKEINIDLLELSIFTVLHVNSDDIYAFMVYLNYHHNSCSTTRERKLAAIKSFYKWIYTKHPRIKKENPTNNIEKITKHFKLPKYLTLEQAKEISSVFNSSNSNYSIRDNAIIYLFLTTGIRISELIGINIEDIDFSSKTIRIIGKGNKERNVYFTENCNKILQKYLETRKFEREEALFLSSRKNRISKSTVEYICRKAFSLIGVGDRHYSPHTLRHTFATIMYASTGDLLLLKKMLGHSTIISTEIYTHVKNDIVKNAVEKNPLNNYTIA